MSAKTATIRMAATAGPMAVNAFEAPLLQAGGCPFGYDKQSNTTPFHAPVGKDFGHHILVAKHEAEGDIISVTQDNGEEIIYVRSPKDIHEVLMSRNFSKTWNAEDVSSSDVDYVMNLIQPFIAKPKCVFNLHADANRDRRKVLRPVLAWPAQFVPAFARTINDDLAKWTNGGTVDILDEVHSVVRKNIFTTLFGEFPEISEPHMETFGDAMHYFVERYSVKDFATEVNAKDTQYMHSLRDAAMVMVLEYKRLGLADKAGVGRTAPSCVGVLLKAGVPDEEIGATVVNLMIAGGEAAASVSAYALEELAFNKPVQDKMLKEILATAGAKGSVAGPIVDDEMPYVDKVTRESLRLFAPATLVLRACVADTELSGRKVKKGQVVGVCATAVHMDEKQFASPKEFVPERKGNMYEILGREQCLMSFSGGERGCPGRHVAAMMVRTMLASVVQQFDISPAGPRSVTENRVKKFVEWQCNGVPVTLRRRGYVASRM